MQTFKRTVYCGKVSEKFLEKEIYLCGWVQKRRDHGELIFIDLRDRTGIVQLVFNPEIGKKELEIAKTIRPESVICVKGVVTNRSEGAINEKLKTGKFEVHIQDFKILNMSEPLPFQLEDAENVEEELRLKYRYLDLRRTKMHNVLKLRNDVIFAIRQHLHKEEFYEIETPILSKSTPEGARDFLVPSRLNPGSFYALPQSPQIYKQLLMAAGLEKYFQVARCFRDEDFRSNRQPEFTQLDLEMSFATEEDVKKTTEDIIKTVWEKTINYKIDSIPSITYQEAFSSYGTDKPDLRFELKINDITKFFENTEVKFLKSVVEKNGKIGAICVPDKKFSRTELDKLTTFTIKELKAKGLLYIRFTEDELPDSAISKFLDKDFLDQITKFIPQTNKKSTLFLIAGNYKNAWTSLGKLREKFGKSLNLIDKDKFAFSWITDFPLFDWHPEDKRWYSTHHPFTQPSDDLEKTELKNVKSKAYDLVCNGEELGGGSIRIYNPKLQEKIFEILGIEKKEAKEKFGFLLEAQKLGFPPHGGLALGLDRIIMTLAKVDSIRDVIAFPKTNSGYCPMMQTPSTVDEKQLKDLYVKSIKK
jgi:aspartyl-tRNA synthetase